MKNNVRSIILLLLISFILLLPVKTEAQYYPQTYNNYNNYNNYNEQTYTVKLDNFEFCTAEQKETQWCWATCIAMALNYYDIPCTQEEVVMRTYGTLVNYPARDLFQIASYMNGWGVTQHGKKVYVTAEAYPEYVFIPFQNIIQELDNGKPFIIGVKNQDGSGHVVVCYGVDWCNTYQGPWVTCFHVFDPWPGNGKSDWDTEELRSRWMGAISIDVQSGR
jgi:ABC-type bacteriocin/lantibiotic exporter with double-glycine peptidase domain